MIGKTYPSEKFSFLDPETGAEIIQHTRTGTTNRTLYFTNRPYTSDGDHIVFLSDRTGRNEMFLLHLKSGKITQLTDLEGQRNVSNCIHPQRPELYFHNRKRLFRVTLDTLKTEELLRAPDGFYIGILNLNAPPWLAFEMIEELNGITLVREGGPKSSSGSYEFHYLHPRSLVYRYNVDTNHLDCIWGAPKYQDHVQISPTNPNLLIFSSWQGYGDNRCYYINASKRVKNFPQPIFPESDRARGSHECFTRRGNLYIQWIEGDLEEGGNHQLYHGFRILEGLSMDQIDRAPFKKYKLPERLGHLRHHFTMSRDETWGIHDRWLTAPTFEGNDSWLSIFCHQKEEPQTVVMKLCFHNGAKGDRLGLGAELTLDNKDEWATYTSFLGGNAHICQVCVTPFVERLFKK